MTRIIRSVLSSSMQAIAIPLLLAISLGALFPAQSTAQEPYFGKNKVIYRKFDWTYIQSQHFDIYYYDEQYDLARFSAQVLEDAYITITGELDYELRSRVPVFIYLSHNDFQQTNITSGLLPEGVGGFTEAFKKRIVIPFTGSYEDYRHVLHHELTHAIVYDMLFGSSLSSILSRQRLFDLPLWFAEGFAEFSSRGGWDYWSDMIVRDATINNYLRPPEYMGGYLAYKEGQAFIGYIAEKYGVDKLGEMLRKGKATLSINRAAKSALGKDLGKVWQEFSLEMKKRYWPDIAKRQTPKAFAKPLTNHGKDGSFFNQKPTFSPTDNQLAIFTDRSDYTEIFLISAKDGSKIKKLTKASRSGDLESLHSYLSGISFSPDGKDIVFVAKSEGYDALFFMNVRKKKTYLKKRIKSSSLLSPSWSPDGKSVAFGILSAGHRDIAIYNIESDEVTQLISDTHDDKDPVWNKDSRSIIFASDRPHIENANPDDVKVDHSGTLANDPEDIYLYGAYNLFRIEVESREITSLPVGPGQNKDPAVSPDGKKLVFVSNRSGIDNLYLHFFDSSGAIAITDVLTGVESPSWSPTGKKIAFSSFYNGGYDIYLMKEILPAGISGELEKTDYFAGKYKEKYKELASIGQAVDTTELIWSSGFIGSSSGDVNGSTRPRSLVADDDDSALTIVADSSGLTEQGEFVFVSEVEKKEKDKNANGSGSNSESEADENEDEGEDESEDALDPLLSDVPEFGRNRRRGGKHFELDSTLFVESRDESGDFIQRPYKTKFTPDYVSGGFSYDNFFGLRGQSFFVFSDYLGNHQFYIATDIVNTLDQSNLQLFYFNNERRTRFGTGIFHSKNFYLQSSSLGSLDLLFSDRFYGWRGFVSRPFSTFSRVEFGASLIFVDRKYLTFNDPREDRSTKASVVDFSYIHDNVLWGFTGPINGSRSKFTISAAADVLSSGNTGFSNLSYYSGEFDYRRYFRMSKKFTAAFRFSGGASGGGTPKRYFLGGTTNWIGRRIVDAEVFEVENLYFSDVVTPLRGYDFYEFSGTRYFLANIEFRYPLIDYLQLNFPLPLALARVQGATFIDIGATWEDDFVFSESVNGSRRLVSPKTGFGWGMRANLGFLLLRYDMAWNTDFNKISPSARSYFSLGADF